MMLDNERLFCSGESISQADTTAFWKAAYLLSRDGVVVEDLPNMLYGRCEHEEASNRELH